MIELGVKSDPIETRYSFEWLFNLMNEMGLSVVQMGSFPELYTVDLQWFDHVKDLADKKNIHLKSLFTAHRELGGFFYHNIYMEEAARKMYERFIDVASHLGADYCGSNPGAVYRDRMESKELGIQCYIKHMKELSCYAYERGLKGLTIEPMSCAAEPPTSREEIIQMMTELNGYHQQNLTNTVPFYLCGDISHGWAGPDKEIIASNYELFKTGLPWMCEFHYKNTDRYYHSTFGFSKPEQQDGIVDLRLVRKIIQENLHLLPVLPVTGYLEISGPKTGRDYSDRLLAKNLKESVEAIKESFTSNVFLTDNI